ncbi:MAG: S-adenosylmethionine:tRNA ribosyltransferase-isomerase [Muribaculaceae bacterium]|nr:S-adenosylmethionine:tRNA ribosyltransferase-isomerase [Muribaculaceae bacterium]
MNPRNIDIKEYNYPLPDEKIAKHPLAQRDACRLLVRDPEGSISDHRFDELPGLLGSDSLLVYNNTKVINARLRFRKASGALIEIFCLEPSAPSDYALNFASTEGCSWQCLVGNSKRWKEGALEGAVTLPDGRKLKLTAERLERNDAGSTIAFSWDDSTVTFSDIISAAGEIPIPPYLNRATEASDSDDYQTVYSRIEGSVAAPTAGLHFTEAVLDAIDRRGIGRREVTLHVGAGTFQPVKADQIGDHAMHSEFIVVSRNLIEELAEIASSGSKKIIAVGTTSVRTLESLYHIGCLISTGEWTGELPQWYPYEQSHPLLNTAEALRGLADWLRTQDMTSLVASTRIIIAPGYDYRIVDGMVTNFHQPQSTLLLLVSAFIGPQWRLAYDHALAKGYRFLSYGDACLFIKPKNQ